MTSGFTKVYQLFVRENIADDSNSIYQLQPSSSETKFISVENYNVNFRKEVNNMIFRWFFTLDPKSVTYQRTVLTFLDCWGFIGGVNEVIHLFGMLIVSSISGKSFVYSILLMLYQVSNVTEQQSNFDDNKFEVMNNCANQNLNNHNSRFVHPKDKNNKNSNIYNKYADQSQKKQYVIKKAVNEMK